jgi:hypothetical protein
MSPDPSGLAFADPENPQSFNLYAYVNNNPLSFVDPTGLSKDCGGGGDKSVVCLVTSFWDWLTKPRGSSSSNNGDTGPSVRPPSDPNFTPQLQRRGTAIQTPQVYHRRVAHPPFSLDVPTKLGALPFPGFGKGGRRAGSRVSYPPPPMTESATLPAIPIR